MGETVSTTTADTAIMVVSTLFWALLYDDFLRLETESFRVSLPNSLNFWISRVCWISSATSFSSELDSLSAATVFTRSTGLIPSLILMRPPRMPTSRRDA